MSNSVNRAMDLMQKYASNNNAPAELHPDVMSSDTNDTLTAHPAEMEPVRPNDCEENLAISMNQTSNDFPRDLVHMPIGFNQETQMYSHQIFDFDAEKDVLLFDGVPANTNGLPEGVSAFADRSGNTVIQFQNGETETLHGASYSNFLDFIGGITETAALQDGQTTEHEAEVAGNVAVLYEAVSNLEQEEDFSKIPDNFTNDTVDHNFPMQEPAPESAEMPLEDDNDDDFDATNWFLF